jgi:hypothetical protein
MDHLNFIDCGFDSTAALLATGCAMPALRGLGHSQGRDQKAAIPKGVPLFCEKTAKVNRSLCRYKSGCPLSCQGEAVRSNAS